MIAPNAQERLTQIVEPLLFWYQKNKRSLPWRDQPTPYRVWVSEIMLQQTRVEAVKPYFERFLSQLPSIQALASCPEDRLLKLWEGLGYYSRARNLQKAARLLVEQYGGQLPADYRQLTALPGIGDYTAGAIASIAFGIAVPAVDGNVLRVISRILCCGDDIGLPQTKQSFRQLLLPVVPQHSAGDFNQALMELGATVCLPSSARCLLCPLAALCRAHQEGCTQQYPVKAPKKARQIQQRTLFAILCRTAEGTFTLLHRRPDSGLLAGLWEIPSVEGALTEEQAQQAAAQLLEPFGLSVLSVQPQKPARAERPAPPQKAQPRGPERGGKNERRASRPEPRHGAAPAQPTGSEDPGLLLISPKAPAQKFSSFEEYMQNRGGPGGPIPDGNGEE